jgi:aldose 1-epimerase
MKSPLIKQSAVLLFLCIVGWAYSQKKEIDKMDIKRENFGRADGQDVFLYTLTNGSMTVKITNYGGIVTELWVPDKKGVQKDVVLGFDKLDGYLAQHPYFGSIVGRYANRIARGKFRLEDVKYTLATNNGPNHLHGGNRGFDKRVWSTETSS